MPAFADPMADFFVVVRVKAAEVLFPPLDHIVPGGLRARVNFVFACCTLSLLLYRSFIDGLN